MATKVAAAEAATSSPRRAMPWGNGRPMLSFACAVLAVLAATVAAAEAAGGSPAPSPSPHRVPRFPVAHAAQRSRKAAARAAVLAAAGQHSEGSRSTSESFLAPRRAGGWLPSSHQQQQQQQQQQSQQGGSRLEQQWNVSYFPQVLDHFNFGAAGVNATFRMKYVWWDGAWAGAAAGGPIFVYCGNEGPVQWFLDNAGWIREIAAEFGALVVGPEHRYYGESMPFGSEGAAYADSASRAFLSTEQALADYAIFITHLKDKLGAHNSPVVVFGGSYGGMLAAWFRLKYPHIAAGALASSAPILQYDDVVPYDTYYRIVSQDFKRESESCFNTIRRSWAVIRRLGESKEGRKQLQNVFGLCSPPGGAQEVVDWLASAYSFLAMVDYPVATDFLMPLPPYPIRQVCRRVDGVRKSRATRRLTASPAMQDEDEGEEEEDELAVLRSVAAGVGVYYNYSGSEKCFETADDPHGMDRGWDVQSCTEHVMPMSSNASNSMFEAFEWNATLFAQQCQHQFGVTPRPTWVLTQFGGRNIKEALKHFGSNIVFSNGGLDPWSGGGVLEDISDTIVSLFIADGAHHLDLRASTPDDPPSVVKQRVLEKQHIARWIEEHRQRSTGLDAAAAAGVAAAAAAALEGVAEGVGLSAAQTATL